jgi:hypothetical protein
VGDAIAPGLGYTGAAGLTIILNRQSNETFCRGSDPCAD